MHLRADVDRYLDGRLPVVEHASLRAHLSSCQACRDYHDQQVHLLRALAGAPRDATRREVERSVARVLAATHPAPRAREALAPQPQRTAWWLPVLGTGFAAAVVLLGVWFQGTSDATGRVVSGAVQVAGLPLQGDALQPDVPVSVGDAPAVVSLRRGARVFLQPHSVMRLRDGGTRVELSQGGARFEVDKGKGKFSVATAQATVVVLGTVFNVEMVGNQQTRVTVVEGRVRVSGVGGCDSELGVGQSALCGQAEEPVVPPAMEPAAAAVPDAVEPPETEPVEPAAATPGEARPAARWGAARIRSVMAQGNQALLEGHAEEAANRAREILAQEPRNAEAHRLLGFVYRRQGRTCEARGHLEDFVQLSRNAEANTAVRALLAEPEFKPCGPRKAHAPP